MKMESAFRRPSDAQRIAPLEVLPVFIRLENKRAIVASGSVGTLWKAELLLQAGARVTLICANPDSAVFELLSQEGQGSIALCTEDWRNVPFDGAALAIGDVSEDEAQSFYEKGRKACAMVNVVDKSQCCDV